MMYNKNERSVDQDHSDCVRYFALRVYERCENEFESTATFSLTSLLSLQAAAALQIYLYYAVSNENFIALRMHKLPFSRIRLGCWDCV